MPHYQNLIQVAYVIEGDERFAVGQSGFQVGDGDEPGIDGGGEESGYVFVFDCAVFSSSSALSKAERDPLKDEKKFTANTLTNTS